MPLTFPNGKQSILSFVFFFQKLAQNLVSQWGKKMKIIGTALLAYLTFPLYFYAYIRYCAPHISFSFIFVMSVTPVVRPLAAEDYHAAWENFMGTDWLCRLT